MTKNLKKKLVSSIQFQQRKKSTRQTTKAPKRNRFEEFNPKKITNLSENDKGIALGDNQTRTPDQNCLT